MNHLSFFKTMKSGIIVSLLILTSTPITYAAMPPSGMPPMSEAELKQLEQQMESEINSFVNSLPPEQQDQFYKDVDALTQEMSKMSEEELSQFIEGVFADPSAPVPPTAPSATPPVSQPTPVKTFEKPVEETHKTKISKKQIEEMVSLLEKIASQIESFVHKSEVILDFPRKVEKWARSGLIPQWKSPNTLPWAEVQYKAIRLAQKMKSFMAQDPTTKEYRFITNLLEDKGLINNLQLLNKKLNEEANIQAPKLDIPEQNGSKLTLASKQAIRRTVDAILEAQTLLRIPEAIDSIIAKFGPIAEKIKKEEEEAVKKALAGLRRPYAPVSARVVGAREVEPYTGPTYQTSDRYSYQTPSYSQYATPQEASSRRDAFDESGRQKDQKKTADQKGSDDKSKGTFVDKKKPEQESKVGKRTVGHIETIGTSLQAASDAIEDILNYKRKKFPEFLKPIASKESKPVPGKEGIVQEEDKTVPGKESADPDILESFDTIQLSLKAAINAISGFNTVIKDEKLTAQEKNKQIDQVKKVISEHMGRITKFKKQLESTPIDASYATAIRIPGTISKFERAVNKIGKK